MDRGTPKTWRYHEYRNAEIEYLAELIDRFGVPDAPPAEEAIKKIKSRFEYLEISGGYIDVADKTDHSPDAYYNLCFKLHHYLFKDILANAGQARQLGDAEGWTVYFGGTDVRTLQPKYEGTHPSRIEEELRVAADLLFGDYPPIESAVRFYAEMAAVHPFYDGNGRVGRLAVSIYLHNYDKYVRWGELDGRHGKFMRKLNCCHDVREKRMKVLEKVDKAEDGLYQRSTYQQWDEWWGKVRDKYIGYLVNFFENYVHDNPDENML